MSVKTEKKPKRKKTSLGHIYNGRRKKIMKATLMLHTSEDHEDRKTLAHIEP
jgi:hypothetical protein